MEREELEEEGKKGGGLERGALEGRVEEEGPDAEGVEGGGLEGVEEEGLEGASDSGGLTPCEPGHGNVDTAWNSGAGEPEARGRHVRFQLPDQSSHAERELSDEEEEEEEEAAEEVWVDLLGDGSVKKKALRGRTEGGGPLPTEGQEVTVDMRGCLDDGSEVERDPCLTFTLGDGEVVKGVEASVRTMRVGEVAHVQLQPSAAYSCMGRPPDIPGSARLHYRLHVLAANALPPPWGAARLRVARRKWEAGAGRLGCGDAPGAERLYRAALALLHPRRRPCSGRWSRWSGKELPALGAHARRLSTSLLRLPDAVWKSRRIAKLWEVAAGWFRGERRDEVMDGTESKPRQSDEDDEGTIPERGDKRRQRQEEAVTSGEPGESTEGREGEEAGDEVGDEAKEEEGRDDAGEEVDDDEVEQQQEEEEDLRVRCLLGLSASQAAQGAMAAALEACGEALQLQPHDAKALLRRGMVLALMGRHEEASESLSSALQLEPTNVVIHSELFKLRRRISLQARDIKLRNAKTGTRKPWALVPWWWLLGAVAVALGGAIIASVARM